MKLLRSKFVIEDKINGSAILAKIEQAGRTCYKSEDKISDESSIKFVEKILKIGHESVIEHEKITVRIICDRGISHEIVRHRIASYSQESTRYCNYSKNKFGSQIAFIEPFYWKSEDELSKKKYNIWKRAMLEAEKSYLELIDAGASPQEARSVLPNSLKTEIVVTMNIREWRHFFKLRTSKAAHPQMREIACPLLDEFKSKIPILFNDIDY